MKVISTGMRLKLLKCDHCRRSLFVEKKDYKKYKCNDKDTDIKYFFECCVCNKKTYITLSIIGAREDIREEINKNLLFELIKEYWIVLPTVIIVFVMCILIYQLSK